MTKNKAIKILAAQKLTKENWTNVNDILYISQTCEYVEHIMGTRNNSFYSLLASFNGDYGGTKQHADRFNEIIDSCIATIKNVGVYKKNFLMKFSNTQVISGLVTAGTILMGIGLFLGKLACH
jgi:hypothetical protein